MAMMSPGRRAGKFGPALSDINVTPLVDVVLVLLIIFMVTAPMMTRGIDVRLPKTESGTDNTEQRLVVTVDRDNSVYINDRPVSVNLLAERLKDEIRRTGQDFVFLKADQSVSYGKVMVVMDQVKKAGADRVGMVTQSTARPAPATRRPAR